MSTESLYRTSKSIETPSQIDNTNNVVELDVLKQNNNNHKISKRVNIETLKQRLLEEKKKEKVKRTIILSSVFFILSFIFLLTGPSGTQLSFRVSSLIIVFPSCVSCYTIVQQSQLHCQWYFALVPNLVFLLLW